MRTPEQCRVRPRSYEDTERLDSCNHGSTSTVEIVVNACNPYNLVINPVILDFINVSLALDMLSNFVLTLSMVMFTSAALAKNGSAEKLR